MELTNSISKNTMKCYQLPKEIACTESHVLNCQNFGEWCKNIPKTLKELCIVSISDNWSDHPKLEEILLPEDRCMLLNILSEELPLELTVPKIEDNFYWKKCFLKKSPLRLPRNVMEKDMFIFPPPHTVQHEQSTEANYEINSTTTETNSEKNEDEVYSPDKTWKQYYLENHMKEFLENLDPDKYDPEEIKKLCDICGPYIRKLHLEELKCYTGKELGHGGTRIALNAVLTGLSKLQEVSICFKQKYVGIDNFSWNVVQLSLQDIKLLSKGLEKIRLHNLRLFNSDLEGTKCVPILKAILKYDNLRTLDFSYCNIGDHGAALVSKFALEVPVKELLFVDNNIGSIGGEALAYILNDPRCSIQILNLRMNPIGTKSGNMILSSLLENKSLMILNLVACNIKVSKVISELLQVSSTLEELYLSNNPIGEDTGNIILNSLNFNRILKKLDLRMCCIHSETQQKISERIKDSVSKHINFIDIRKNGIQLEFSKSFLLYFENIRISEELLIDEERIHMKSQDVDLIDQLS